MSTPPNYQHVSGDVGATVVVPIDAEFGAPAADITDVTAIVWRYSDEATRFELDAAKVATDVVVQLGDADGWGAVAPVGTWLLRLRCTTATREFSWPAGRAATISVAGPGPADATGLEELEVIYDGGDL